MPETALMHSELTDLVQDPYFVSRLGLLSIQATRMEAEGAFALFRHHNNLVYSEEVHMPGSAAENGNLDPRAQLNAATVLSNKGWQDPELAAFIHVHTGNSTYSHTQFVRYPSDNDLRAFAETYPFNPGFIGGIIATDAILPAWSLLLYRANSAVFDPTVLPPAMDTWEVAHRRLDDMAKVGIQHATLHYYANKNEPYGLENLKKLYVG